MHLISYFKSLPHSIANPMYNIGPSLYKDSSFPFQNKKKKEYVTKPYGFTLSTKWFISSRKIEQIRKDDLLQCTTAICYSSAPSSTDLYLVTPGLLSLPSEMSYNLLTEQGLWHVAWECTPAISAHLPCREQGQPWPPDEINLALQPKKKSFWPEIQQAGEEYCLLEKIQGE